MMILSSMCRTTWVILYHEKISNNELFRILVHVVPMVLNQDFSPSSAFLGKAVKSSLWHHRLGHPLNEILKAMLMNSDVSFNNDVHVQPCSHCFSGKMSRLSISRKTR